MYDYDLLVLGSGHVFGTGATDSVQIGQTVMGCGSTVDYLVDTVFNYPTLAESYKWRRWTRPTSCAGSTAEPPRHPERVCPFF